MPSWPKPPPDEFEKQPRIRKDFSSFEQWETHTEAYWQASYARGTRQRSMFDMFGQSVAMETHMPWNFFKQTTTRWVCMDFNITEDSQTMEHAREYGAEWEEGYYADEGYGWPVFGDAEKCWQFLKEYTTWKEQKDFVPVA